MENEQVSLSRYGKTFQENLCQLILLDRPFCDQITEVLDSNFLELRYLRVFIEIIIRYRKKYGVHPTYKVMTTIIRSDIDAYNLATQKQIRDYYARILNTEVDGAEYIKDTALDFCRKQILKEAMIKSVKLLKTSSFEQISSVINGALKLGSDNNFGHEFLKDFELRYIDRPRHPVSTGWEEIDRICQGGLGRRELGVVIAPTGAGKSMILVHLAANALKMGLNVVFYTMELAEEVVGQRFDSCISQVFLDDLPNQKAKVYDDISKIEGKLIIKEYPTKSASVDTIRAHLERVRQRDFEPDMILVDYGDILRPVKSNTEKRHELQEIYEQLRAIAQELNCPVWTASQTNRTGLNAEVVTMESISEAFSKCFVADFIFSLSRTNEDKVANTGRLFIAKNRNGPDGIVYPVFMDAANVCIKVLSARVSQSMPTGSSESIKERMRKIRRKK